MAVSPLSESREPASNIGQEALGDLSIFPNEIIAEIFKHHIESLQDWLNCTRLSSEFRAIAYIPEVFVAVCRQFGRLQQGFIYALKRGDTGSLKRILDAGIQFTAPGDRSPLDFIENNQKEILELLVEEKLLAFSNTECHQALRLAAACGSYGVVDTFLDCPQINVNTTNQERETPFHLAAKGGHADILELLIKKYGGVIGLKTCQEAFLLAAANGHSGAVVFLLKIDGVLFYYENERGENALCLAVKGGSTVVVGLLLDRFGNELKKTIYYEQAFLCAAQSGCSEIVALFLKDPNLNVKITDDFGLTALHLAVKSGDVETVRILMQRRGYSFKKLYVEDALRLAAERGYTQCFSLIRTYGKGNINAVDEDKHTALHHAVLNNEEETVAQLLDQENIDVNIEDSEGKTPLFYAVEGNKVNLVALFINKAVFLLKKEILEEVLRHAVTQRYLAITKLLLEVDKIDVNAQDSYGYCILSLAVSSGRPELVRLIVERRGGDFTQKEVQRALSTAEKNKTLASEMAQILQGLQRKEEAVSTEEPLEQPQFSKNPKVTSVLIKVALIAGLILTTILAVLAVQGLLLPYSIIGTAAVGTVPLILGGYFIISRCGRQRSVES